MTAQNSELRPGKSRKKHTMRESESKLTSIPGAIRMRTAKISSWTTGKRLFNVSKKENGDTKIKQTST